MAKADRIHQVAVLNRRAKVERLMKRGVTSLQQMAARLGVSVPTICNDVKAIHECWKSESPDTRKERMLTRIRQLEAIAIEAYNAWDKSKLNAEAETDNTYTKPCPICHGVEPEEVINEELEVVPQPPCTRCKGEGVIHETKTVRLQKGQCGDPAYLQIAKECFRECARLEGLYVKRTDVKVKGTVSHIAIPEGKYADAPPELLLAVRAGIAKLKESVVIDTPALTEVREKDEE